MRKDKMKVLISDKLSESAVNVFHDNGISVDFSPELGKSAVGLAEKINQYHGLVIRSNTKVTKEILNKATRLKVIGRAGVGIDNVNLTAASANGIVVMNTPFGNSITTAEHTIAMILSVARQIPDANISTHSGKWEKSKFLGTEIMGKTLGLIGAGNVGSVVASRAIGLKMRVVAFDPFLSSEKAKDLGVIKVDTLVDVLNCSDFVSLHLPMNEKTRNIISKEEINCMKPGAKIINCARGGLVDEEAIAAAIVSGKLAGAAFDVFSDEPAFKSPLFGLANVVCTPHLGASTKEAQENVAIQVSEQMCDFLISGALTNSLNAPSLTAEEVPILTPWIKVAEAIGSFAGQVTESAVKELEIEFAGAVSQLNLQPLVAGLVSSLLLTFVGEGSVNMVSAPIIAKQRGIKISEIRKESLGAFESYIRLKVVTERENRSIAGTIYSDGKPRFIQIKGINLDSEPQKFMLYTTNMDSPGYIGALGTVLGNLDVNIATFALGRSAKKGHAIALLGVDDMITENILKKVRELPQVLNAYSIVFN